jgi:uncharacterized protein YbjT (DUF2867 family)
MTALLAGATGLVGRELARHWTGPGDLILLLRRAGGAPSGPRLRPLQVDYSALPALPAAQEAWCCLGTTIALAGSQPAFRAVDFDAVLAFARAARAAGVLRFGLVSALGADAAARSFYARVKGEAEAAVAGLGFDSLVIARPSLLAGDRAALGQPGRPAERLGLALTQPLGRLVPVAWRPIPAPYVARSLLRAVREGRPGLRILSSTEMHSLGTP